MRPLYSARPIIRDTHTSGGRERLPDGTHHHGGHACAPPRARTDPVRASTGTIGSRARPRGRKRVLCAPPRARTDPVHTPTGAIGSRAHSRRILFKTIKLVYPPIFKEIDRMDFEIYTIKVQFLQIQQFFLLGRMISRVHISNFSQKKSLPFLTK
jgi:hypothetical protein